MNDQKSNWCSLCDSALTNFDLPIVQTLRTAHDLHLQALQGGAWKVDHIPIFGLLNHTGTLVVWLKKIYGWFFMAPWNVCLCEILIL